jgi:hypothetical protein
MPFKSKMGGGGTQTPSQPEPPDQTVVVSYISGNKKEEETFFSVKNVGVDPSATFLILSKKGSSTFIKLDQIDRVELEIQKVDLA